MAVQYKMNKNWDHGFLTPVETQVATMIDTGSNTFDEIRDKLKRGPAIVTLALERLEKRGLLTKANDGEPEQKRDSPAAIAAEMATMEINDLGFKILKNFNLANINETFKISDFQRRVHMTHVNKIYDAIIAKQFYDNVISVVPMDDGRYEVIDGQNRLLALEKAFKRGDLEKYTLLLRIFKTDEAREVYRRINSGKPLSMADFIKSLDDGKLEFFKVLRNFCSHYPERMKVQYVTIAQGLNYSNQDGHYMVFGRKALINAVCEASDDDLKTVREFMMIMRETVGTDRRESLYYRLPVFYNLLRVFMKRGGEQRKLVQLLRKIENDSYILEQSKYGATSSVMASIYSRLLEKW